MFLLQFDACNRDLLGIGSIGYVLYYDSIVIFEHYSLLDKSYNSNYAECKALINALQYAIDINIKELYVEGDAKIVIEQINNNCNINCNLMKPLLEEVNNLKKEFNVIDFQHIYRKYNTYADSLANYALYKHIHKNNKDNKIFNNNLVF